MELPLFQKTMPRWRSQSSRPGLSKNLMAPISGPKTANDTTRRLRTDHLKCTRLTAVGPWYRLGFEQANAFSHQRRLKEICFGYFAAS